MNNLLSYNEKNDLVEQPAKIKPGVGNFGGLPFPLYAIWAPDRQGYLAGIPLINDNETIVRDNELDYKQILLFITNEKAQEEIDSFNRYLTSKKNKIVHGDIECVKKLIIVRLNPDNPGPPPRDINPN